MPSVSVIIYILKFKKGEIMNYDVIIIGGGPAGLTAGIYASRGGLNTAIISGLYTGGQAALTEKIENFSGYKEIDGFTLTYNMRSQAESFGVNFIEGSVTDLDLSGAVKSIKLDSGEEFTSGNVILAMGASNRKLGIENEDNLIGKGVSYCATCDGGFFRKKAVAVVGGGDTAVTDALYLKRLCSKVYLIHRRQGFRAAKVLVDRLVPNGIELILDSTVTKLNGEPLESITVKNKITGETKDLEVSGVFVAVGTVPNTELLQGKVQLNEKGYILTKPDMQTDVEGVYAAGDIRETPLRQVITACADGAIAANSVIEKSMTYN